nr:DUF4384 domain-containing protein [Saprospiraceae bacterium]
MGQNLKGIIVISIILLFGVLVDGNAQAPIWVNSYGSQTPYSEAEYLTGFGMASISDGITTADAIVEAEAMARENLTQKVQVNIEASTTQFTEENIAGDIGEYASSFSSEAKFSVNQEFFGLNVENHVDEQKGRIYALSNIRRATLINQYQDRLETLHNNFLSLRETMQQNADNDRGVRAFEIAMEAKAEYSKMVEAWSVLNSLHSQKEWNPREVSSQFESVNKFINDYLNRPVRSLDDAAWWISNTIGSAGEQNYRVNISTITYRDSGISSEFANYLRQLLNRQLASQTRWSIQEMNSKPDFAFTGTYWDRGSDVQLMLNLREIETGQIITATEVTIPKQVIEDADFEILPDNYEEALADIKALKENKGDNRGLKLEVWTNRGEENLVFEEGELLEVSLQVNLPSYVRILYHLKDGTRVLLVDSHFMNERDINKPYTLPYQFECVPPFGVEMMQVIAQSDPFERVQTKEIDGIPYLAEDLEEFLTNTRGFKVKKQEAQQAEEIVTITTMPRSN